MDTKTHSDFLPGTVGELREWLAGFPDDAPITTAYDGTGRVYAFPSYEDDELGVVVIAPADPAWLDKIGEPRANPAETHRRATAPFWTTP